MRISLVFSCGLLLALAPRSLAAPVDFNRDIRPILASQCYACHGPDPKARKADLRLDLRDSAVEAGVITPGKPDDSELLRRIASSDPDEVMPPVKSKKPRLTAVQVDLFKRWIAEGANYSEHWSFAKLTRPAVPEISNLKSQISNPIDAFILYRLKQEGVKPAAEADRATLIRRLSFDLTGLPPTVAEIRAFVNDRSSDAYEKLVDRLMASPHYGERMAVWWLDLVRYADSIGYHSDNPMNVSPYRDYVIRSFNENKPFDQFTIEQLAGDLLPNPTQWQKVATAYNRLLQTTEEGGAQPKEYEAKYASDRVRNFGQVWLGGTIMCAECHDHKFDPYTQKDFYSLAAFFADVQEASVGRREPGMAVTTPEQDAELARIDAAFEAARKTFETAAEKYLEKPNALKKLGEKVKIPANLQKIFDLPAAKWNANQQKQVAAFLTKHVPELKDEGEELAAAEKRKADFEATIDRVLITRSGPPRTVRILARGNWQDTSGPVMTPNTPEFLPPLPKLADPKARYTRLDLAKWTVSPENPLIARVAVNRLWKLFYGHGIARSLEESGTQGQLPTHPELLDWLASEFQKDWDIKHIVRLMVTSSTYRQSSAETPEIRERDPFNELYARQSRWRLDAEFIRDNALSVSGLLNREIGGRSVKPYQPPGYWSSLNFPTREWQKDTGDKVYRRGMYTHWQRTFPHPAMVAFDAPSREECTCERPQSNIPQQALVLLNDPEFVEAAKAFAVRTLGAKVKDDASRVAFAFETATGRKPKPEETKILLGILREHREFYSKESGDAEALLKTGDMAPPENLKAGELAAWTNVCRVMLNLHETMTRQ